MRKTPQEKKGLSFQKDGRNAYGNNDKASRKGLPRKKKLTNRAYRRRANAPLMQPHVASDPDVEISIDPRLVVSSPRWWPRIKQSDRPLAEHVLMQLYRRACKGMISEEAYDDTEARVMRSANPKSRHG